MAVIPLTKGKFAIVDDDMFEYLNQWKWCYSSGNSGYAMRFERRLLTEGNKVPKHVQMHRVIHETGEGLFTDHINGNKLDNRKCNLRSVTRQQNQFNKKAGKTSKSGFKGVKWVERVKKWRVSMSVGGKFIHIGYYGCLGFAAKKYNEAANQYHGEYARLNKVRIA